ncbi:MAG TPA: type I glutamate--ammonia ligase [Treponema sp.]|nr:type I glutamate--ammonia ligase [Treponema sp.]
MLYTESEILQYIAENDVKFIKLFFTDIFGTIKSISIQPKELERAFKTGISFDASAVKGFLEVDKSDLFIVPDPSTLSVLPWRPQHGRVVRFFCNIRYVDGTPFEGDMRYILQNVVGQSRKTGYDIKIGTECEFYLFQTDEKGDPTLIPHDNAGYCDLAPRDKGENIRRDICLTLEQMGIQPESSHHETGPGQHEVDFKYNFPLQAADNLGTFKTVVKTVAARNGLYASFLPKPLAGKAGSGLHINLSLEKNGKNIFSDDELPPEAESFMAGILYRIREITAFLNPLKSSYDRFGSFEAPLYVSWSSLNRSQLIRLPAAEKERRRMELRSPDPSCNQYAALALIISAGFEGIKEKRPLPPALDMNMFKARPVEIQGVEMLPKTFTEALKLTEASSFVKTVLPEVTVNAFVDAGGEADE